MSRPLRVAVWCAVSTPQQATVEKDSLPAQERPDGGHELHVPLPHHLTRQHHPVGHHFKPGQLGKRKLRFAHANGRTRHLDPHVRVTPIHQLDLPGV